MLVYYACMSKLAKLMYTLTCIDMHVCMYVCYWIDMHLCVHYTYVQVREQVRIARVWMCKCLHFLLTLAMHLCRKMTGLLCYWVHKSLLVLIVQSTKTDTWGAACQGVLRVQTVSYALRLKRQHVHQKRLLNDIHDFPPAFLPAFSASTNMSLWILRYSATRLRYFCTQSWSEDGKHRKRQSVY